MSKVHPSLLLCGPTSQKVCAKNARLGKQPFVMSPRSVGLQIAHPQPGVHSSTLNHFAAALFLSPSKHRRESKASFEAGS